MAYVSDQVPERGLWKPARLRVSAASPVAGRPDSPSAEILAGLTRAIEADVVPQLVLAHRTIPAIVAIEPDKKNSSEVARFAEMILAQDTSATCAEIQQMRDQGKSLEAIYIELLAPAAVRLRDLWSADLCGFADVTLALWRLQQILREFSPEFRAEGDHAESGLRALLVPAPGEKNELGYVMFGLVMMAEFLRRDGVDTWIETDSESKEFNGIIRSQWFDVVELLVKGDKKMDALADRIRMIRRESPNRGIGVMVCGPAFVEHPELVLLVGADVAANDPRQSAVEAKKVVGQLANRE
jgi:hypothetical protein